MTRRASFFALPFLAFLACSADRSQGETAQAPAAPAPVRVAALPSAAPAVPVPTPADAPPRAVMSAETPTENPEARALSRCIETSKLRECLPIFAGKKMDDFDSSEVQAGATCTRACIEAREYRLRPAIDAAVATCKEAYEKSRGKAAVRCVFPKAKAPSDPRQHSMRFQDALRAALEKPSETTAAALDAMLPVLDSGHWSELEPDCTKRCRAEGAAALAATTGP